MKLLSTSTLVSSCFFILASASASDAESPDLQTLVQRANTLLTSGQFSDAARAYSDALALAPHDSALYYKRATAYLSSNRNAQALDDFNTVLELTNRSFDGAHLAKAKIFAKEGRWTEGREALKEYSKAASDRVAGDLLFSISEGEVATKKAAAAQTAGQWEACVEAATSALQTATYSITLRRQRADCALSAGDFEQTVADLTRLTHLDVPSTSLLLRIATLSYYLMEPSGQALSTVKQCLHFDPDSKPCKTAHKQLKALDKLFTQLEKANEGQQRVQVLKVVVGQPEGTGLAAKYDEAMAEAVKALDPPLPETIVPTRISVRRAAIYRSACRNYVQGGEIRKSESWCAELLRMDKDDVDGLVGSGEAALKKEQWEEAVRMFDRAFEASGRQSHDVHGKLQKAQRLLKQSKKKDYYKVLGVSRDADVRTIKKAYRKVASKAHPDKGGTEAQMAAVNEAYEVLSKEELRQRYDNGDDPNDPESQFGPGGGHPFHGQPFQFFQQGGGGGGHPFGGGGGQQWQFQWSG